MTTTRPDQTAETVNLCPSTAAQCRCGKPDGHVEAGDLIHGCHPDRCTGQWVGEYGTDTFNVVSLPFAVGEPVPW